MDLRLSTNNSRRGFVFVLISQRPKVFWYSRMLNYVVALERHARSRVLVNVERLWNCLRPLRCRLDRRRTRNVRKATPMRKWRRWLDLRMLLRQKLRLRYRRLDLQRPCQRRLLRRAVRSRFLAEVKVVPRVSAELAVPSLDSPTLNFIIDPCLLLTFHRLLQLRRR